MRYALYDVVYKNVESDKRETSIFTFDSFAGSSPTEQWYNRYPYTFIVEIHPLSIESE